MPEESSASSSSNSESELKNKRTQARGRATRATKRLNEAIAKEDKKFRRFEKEVEHCERISRLHTKFIVNYTMVVK